MLKLSRLNLNQIFKNNIHNEVRKKLKEKTSPKNLALEYFDFFYGSTYGQEWHKMRLALLTGRKYTALVNNYSDWTETVKNLQNIAALNFFDYLLQHNLKELVDKNQDLENTKYFDQLKLPQALKIFLFDNGDTRQFDSPKANLNNLLDYYCIDGASILPVLALGIKKDDCVLDLCASPGGKSLVMLQTLLPKHVTCRDINTKRLERLGKMLRSYIPENEFSRLVTIEYNTLGIKKPDENLFDKILVDVPCTNDRHSLFTDENNIFSKHRSEERTNISKKQAELLTQGILACKPNGTIVYSTCSLSPIQNEGVVNGVLNSFEGNGKFRLKIESLDYMKEFFSYFFQFSPSCKTGLLVAPDIQKNFGPFYLCKIIKEKI